jgi:hypothetical protein
MRWKPSCRNGTQCWLAATGALLGLRWISGKAREDGQTQEDHAGDA